MAALTQMAVLRDAIPTKPYLHSLAVELSKENVSLTMQAIRRVGRQEREDGETSLPSLGRLLREMRAIEDETHPLRVLRSMVRRLAAAYGKRTTPEMLQVWEETCGHRTDEDLEVGYKALLRELSREHMPRPGELIQRCPIFKIRRDGSKA